MSKNKLLPMLNRITELSPYAAAGDKECQGEINGIAFALKCLRINWHWESYGDQEVAKLNLT